MSWSSGLSRLNGLILQILTTFCLNVIVEQKQFSLLEQAKNSIVWMKHKTYAWYDNNKCLAASAWFPWHSLISNKLDLP